MSPALSIGSVFIISAISMKGGHESTEVQVEVLGQGGSREGPSHLRLTRLRCGRISWQLVWTALLKTYVGNEITLSFSQSNDSLINSSTLDSTGCFRLSGRPVSCFEPTFQDVDVWTFSLFHTEAGSAGGEAALTCGHTFIILDDFIVY